jgi:hypothetical protein
MKNLMTLQRPSNKLVRVVSHDRQNRRVIVFDAGASSREIAEAGVPENC